jgi:DNA-directed RNA polymerase subunit F
MTTPTAISEKPLSLYDVRTELKRIKKRDETLSVRAGRVQEYVDLFATLSDKKAQELKESIVKLDIPRMKPEYVEKLIDLLPVTIDQVKAFATSYNLTIKQDHMQKIVDMCSTK